VRRLPIQSISGGTDIIGCFVLGNPLLPVYPGECQCRSLGLDVRALCDEGADTGIGELVCANAFPSRPLGLLDDPDGGAFHAAYFAQHPGMWTHGDLIEFTPEGSARMHGRCDGVLNVRGIRIGPAEIYRILAGLPEIVESMAVEQSTPQEVSGSRLVLLVVLREGVVLDAALISRIKRELGRHGSAAHVPAVILAVGELPTTHSGKRSERSARDALNSVAVANAAALRNPECLAPLKAFAAAGVTQAQAGEAVAARAGEPLLETVIRAWERALGVSPLGAEDSFFDLGGESIAALRICAELQPAVGREIPVTLLVKAPTIAAMTAALETPGVCLSYQPLWLLRRQEGPPPLYIVPGFGGSAMELVALARELRVNRSVYAIQARGYEPGDEPHRSVEEMAREYLQRVRELQPHGPYLLAGYSFGGLVAYEMARLLAQAGEPVEQLVLLDTAVHERCWPAAAWLEFIWRRASCHARRALTLAPWRWGGLVRHLWRAAMRRVKRTWRAGVLEDIAGAGLPEAVRRVRRAALGAMAAYRPQRCELPVALIRSPLARSRDGDPRLIWRSLVSQLQMHDVPGDHLMMLRPPHLQALAQQLSRAVEGMLIAAAGAGAGSAPPLTPVPGAARGSQPGTPAAG
jgi:acetoacetyl-CoA synthetase